MRVASSGSARDHEWPASQMGDGHPARGPGIHMSNAPSARKRVVITTFGSLGDLHPALALALELKARGHTPVLATSEAYRSRTEALDIEFSPVRPDLPTLDDPHTAGTIARSLDVKRGGEYLLRQVLLPAVRDAY